jgi:hypothetical protein
MYVFDAHLDCFIFLCTVCGTQGCRCGSNDFYSFAYKPLHYGCDATLLAVPIWSNEAVGNIKHPCAPPFAFRSGLSAVSAACLLTILSGCASQGPLHPPSLKLPAPVNGLVADRVGDAVDLHWTTPTKTTDGVGLAGKHGAGALTAEICRSETATVPARPATASGSRAAATASCGAPTRIAVTAGEIKEFHDVLPPPLVSGPLRPLYYRVRVLNAAGKGAKYVLVDTLAGIAPPPIRGLTAAPVANGVNLRWQPDAAANGARTVLRVERVRPVVAAPPKPAFGVAPAAAPLPPRTELLAVEPAANDPGGAIDAEAKPGIEQRYSVFRTQTLRSGEKDLTASSPAVTVTVSAAAKAPPPPPPSGLEALVNTLGAPEIDLVWQPAEGAAGYLVFRAEGSGAPIQLTPQTISGLSYADTAVHAGARYRYTVKSVDASGAFGPPSPELVQAIPQP